VECRAVLRGGLHFVCFESVHENPIIFRPIASARFSWLGTSFPLLSPNPNFADEIIVTAQKGVSRACRTCRCPSIVIRAEEARRGELQVLRYSLSFSAESQGLYAEGSFGRTFTRFLYRGLGNTDFSISTPIRPVSPLFYDGCGSRKSV